AEDGIRDRNVTGVQTCALPISSGSGSTLQALLDAGADRNYGAHVVAVGADRDGIEALQRADRAGVPTFVEPLTGYSSREEWDQRSEERRVGKGWHKKARTWAII